MTDLEILNTDRIICKENFERAKNERNQMVFPKDGSSTERAKHWDQWELWKKEIEMYQEAIKTIDNEMRCYVVAKYCTKK